MGQLFAVNGIPTLPFPKSVLPSFVANEIINVVRRAHHLQMGLRGSWDGARRAG
jgi:hypothetical protein